MTRQICSRTGLVGSPRVARNWIQRALAISFALLPAFVPTLNVLAADIEGRYTLVWEGALPAEGGLKWNLGSVQLSEGSRSPIELNLFVRGGRVAGGIRGDERVGWLYPFERNGLQPCKSPPHTKHRVVLRRTGDRLQLTVDGEGCLDLVIDESRTQLLDYSQVLVGATSQHASPYMSALREDTALFDSESWVQRVEQVSYRVNALTQMQERMGWRLLWDGHSSAGWRGVRLEEFPQKGWEIRDGVLSVLSSGGAESRNGGDIITIDNYQNFDLELDFKITAGANSGIKYFVLPDLLKGEGSAIGLEFQILDDALHPDAKKGLNGNRTVGSLYDLIPAENIVSLADAKPFLGVGMWNRARVRVCGVSVEHWLNNSPVVRYQRATQMFRALVSHSKYAKWKGFGEAPSGPILLQDHGDLVSFRTIKIRPLTPKFEGDLSCK